MEKRSPRLPSALDLAMVSGAVSSSQSAQAERKIVQGQRGPLCAIRDGVNGHSRPAWVTPGNSLESLSNRWPACQRRMLWESADAVRPCLGFQFDG